ncbi:MAG: hypothetical protein LLG40_11180 [Deltaproteobacteria bacterium]|nr:hypothetical protein [Deltaproteobacteria bacterium]
MANIKKITHFWNTTGLTLYCIIRRDADGYLLNDADGAFASGPADPYISLAEDAVIKGMYELSESRAAWDDGNYSIVVYRQTGASPAPASDIVIGSGSIEIRSDLEVINVNVKTSDDKINFALTSAYDKAKTAAQAGDAMTLTAAYPKLTDLEDVATIQNGLATAENQATIIGYIQAVPAAVWAVGTRTLTSFGTLVSSVAAAVWNSLTSAILTTGSIGKLLTDNVDGKVSAAAAPTTSENAAAVWAYASRTLTGVTGTISWPVISNSIKQDYIDAITALVSGNLPLGETEKIFAINKALQSYSALRPRLVAEDEDGTGSADYLITLLADFIDGFSVIKSVEYPVDDDDEEGANILQEDDWKIYQKPTGKYLRFTDNKPATTEDFRVVYTAMHRCTDEACTIPLIDEGAVQLLAAAYYCDMLATYYAQTSDSTIMADSVDHKSKASEYAARGRAYRAEYKNHMGVKDGNNVGAASVTKDQDVKTSHGYDAMTHPKRFR